MRKLMIKVQSRQRNLTKQREKSTKIIIAIIFSVVSTRPLTVLATCAMILYEMSVILQIEQNGAGGSL